METELLAPTTTTTTTSIPATTTPVPDTPPSSDGGSGWVGPAIGLAGLTLLGTPGVTLARRHRGS